ncbi:MAG: aminotransferase class I/II-fold pyridoxal phosphate-dependent enzyme, partial [Pseudomonadota bacterium]
MQINPNVRDCAPAPIAQAWTWVSDRPTNAAPVIDACQAVPTEPPPAFHSEAVASAIVDGSAMNYTPIAGLDPLRAALAADLSERYGASIAATDAIITAGCNQAFCTAIDAVAGAGDNVVLPVPYYFNHDMWLGIRGIEPRYLTPDDAMIPSPDAA